jgi:polar amino acid transport system substrate-binding protein
MALTFRTYALPIVLLGLLLSLGSSAAPVARKKPVIKLATAHFPPFRIHEGGVLSGSDVEIVQEIFRRMGFEPEIEVAPFKRVFAMAGEGQVAAIFSLTRNPEREKVLLFSDPVSSVSDALFKRADNKLEWNSYPDLKGLTIGMSLGYSYPEQFLNAMDANIFRPDQVASAEPELTHLRKLQQGRIDLAICEISVCSWLIARNKAELGNLVPMKKLIAAPRPFLVGFSKKWPDADGLRRKFNRELARYVAQGNRRTVFKKYNINEP